MLFLEFIYFPLSLLHSESVYLPLSLSGTIHSFFMITCSHSFPFHKHHYEDNKTIDVLVREREKRRSVERESREKEDGGINLSREVRERGRI